MIKLFPSQYLDFTRRVRRYGLLLGLLQLVMLLVIVWFELFYGGALTSIWLFGRPIRLVTLWLIQSAALAGLWALGRRLAVRVICPQCLTTLTRVHRHRVYYCPACDQYTDDGTMARLAETPLPPVRSLTE